MNSSTAQPTFMTLDCGCNGWSAAPVKTDKYDSEGRPVLSIRNLCQAHRLKLKYPTSIYDSNMILMFECGCIYAVFRDHGDACCGYSSGSNKLELSYHCSKHQSNDPVFTPQF